MNFYKQAAEKGHDIAQKFLGAAYFKGIGTDKNHALAEKWFKILAEKDNVNGQTYLGYIYAMGDGVNQNLIESSLLLIMKARNELLKIQMLESSQIFLLYPKYSLSDKLLNYFLIFEIGFDTLLYFQMQDES